MKTREINKVSHFYQGLLLEEDKEQENNEREILYIILLNK
jgi:hypothetical protein